jgi:RNA polymerase sigma factor (sigma-70 family)
MGAVGQLTDGQLLERFTTGSREAAEPAFTALVERHGPMVLRVCQGALGDAHDAQDAFQATFLVLVRRAGTVRNHQAIGSWLHGVALRVATKAKVEAARRRTHERRGAERAATSIGSEADPEDLRSVLDAEVGRLPEKYRAPIVLCYLEGLTHEQAAERLGWPVGTVRGRLARARDVLRARLTRRSLALPVGLLAAGLSPRAVSAAVPATLVEATVQAAIRFAAGKATTTGLVPVAVVALAEGALRMMFLTKLKLAGATLLALGVIVTAGAGVLTLPDSGAMPPAPAEKKTLPVASDASAASRPQRPAQPPAELAERLDDDVELLKAQLDAKRAELEGARAQRELAKAIVATHQRLNQRRPGMVSDVEMRKAESEENTAAAQIERLLAEIRVIELRLDQANRVQGRPERMKEYLERVSTADSLSALDRRLREVERKLDQILNMKEDSKRAEGR